MTWRVGDWGPACGPRPSGGGQGGGLVQITDYGSSFQLTGLGRTYRSNQCWEQMPGLNPVSSQASGSTFSASCSTGSGDARQAKVTTTWTVRENTVYFDESGQYQFVVQGQNCTASVRRTRLLHRVISEPAKPAPAEPSLPEEQSSSAPRPTPAEPPSPISACSNPGPPQSLEVSPESKLMLPGEQFTFRAQVRDARGCVLPISPTWKLLEGAQLARLVRAGTVEVLPDAPNGRIELQASVSGRAVKVSARVVTRESYEGLLEAGDYEESGESTERAETTLASSTVEAQVEVVQPEASNRSGLRLLLGLLLGSAVAAAALMLGRRRKRGSPTEDPAPDSDLFGADTATVPHGGDQRPVTTRGKVCPVCGETYPPDGAQFCGKDGARLVLMN